MTFNEAKDIFLNRGYVEVDGGQIFDGDKWRQCIVVISEWLKQDPCKDCISRQAVIDMTGLSEWFDSSDSYNEFVIALSDLPSAIPQQEYGDIAKAFQFGLAFGFAKKYDEMDEVMKEVKKAATPKPKIGHWIEVHPLQEDDGGAYMCSKCRCGHPYIAPHWKYCPNCGARMVEPKGSEG